MIIRVIGGKTFKLVDIPMKDGCPGCAFKGSIGCSLVLAKIPLDCYSSGKSYQYRPVTE